MALAVPDPSFTAAITAAGAQTNASIGTLTGAIKSSDANFTTVMQEISGKALTAEAKKELEDKKGWWTKYLEGRGKWIREMGQRIAQFSKTMEVIMRFYPIVKVFIGIILIFTNLIVYLIMLYAFIVIVIIEATYWFITVSFVIYIVWVIFFFFTEVVAFLIYSAICIAILLFVTVICAAFAVIDIITGGWMRGLLLCQNSPAAWYKIPNHHNRNMYMRSGFFCSRPCMPRYRPDETLGSCEKLKSSIPDYCPQAQVMRLYSRSSSIVDGPNVYNDFREKGNLKYLTKTPDKREEMILDHFDKQREFLSECNKPESDFGMPQHNHISLSACSVLDNLNATEINKYNINQIRKLQEVCSQQYCTSDSTYPFCKKMSQGNDFDSSDFIRKIIIFLISLTVFILMVIFLFKTVMENSSPGGAARE